MAAPGTFTSGQVLTAAEMNALPGGVMGTDENTSDVTITTSSQTIANVTFTSVSGRKYLAMATFETNDASTSLVLIAELEDSVSGKFKRIVTTATTTDTRQNMTFFGIFTGTGASQTINLDAATSTGTINAKGTADPILLAIYDMGD